MGVMTILLGPLYVTHPISFRDGEEGDGDSGSGPLMQGTAYASRRDCMGHWGIVSSFIPIT